MDNSMFPHYPVLIIDDEDDTLHSFEITLNSRGIDNIVLCQDSREVFSLLSSQKYEIILLDLTMPHMSGEELLIRVVEEYPDTPVIIITGDIEVDTAVRCMKKGAFDYLVKPVEDERLGSVVKRVIENNRLQRENRNLKHQLLHGELTHPEVFSNIITGNSVMVSILKYVEVIGRSPEPVLLTGDTGVGKELVARAIHNVSGRKGAFVPVNVAGLDDNMFSDTLFGHQKGAFTDAHQQRGGLIKQASGGTIFLDEIGDLSMASQVKLLRLIQEHEYFPLGSDILNHCDARIVVATNRVIEKLLESGQFRKDLYYRIEVHRIHIPPLCQRRDDIPLMVNFFLDEASESLGKKKPTPPKELFILLDNYSFPGNVRELRSLVFDAVSSHTSGILSLKSFKKVTGDKKREDLGRSEGVLPNEHFLFQSSKPLPSLKQAEILLIKETLKQVRGNQSIAARMLGITRQTLHKKLKYMK